MRSRALAIGGSIAALSLAAAPVVAASPEAHSRDAKADRHHVERSRDAMHSRDRDSRDRRSIGPSLPVPSSPVPSSPVPSSPAPSSPAPSSTQTATGTTTTSTATTTANPTVDWQIAVNPSSAFPTATGSAQYQSQPGQRELQIEVEHLVNLTGQYVSFYANGAKFGVGKVSSLGIVQIASNTELGQSVPWIVHGSTVAVRTSTGVLIASGQF
jgi:hypothetical protein